MFTLKTEEKLKLMNIKILKPVILVNQIRKLSGLMVCLAKSEGDKLASVIWSGPERGWEFHKGISAGEILTAPEALEKDILDFKLNDQKFHIIELDTKYTCN